MFGSVNFYINYYNKIDTYKDYLTFVVVPTADFFKVIGLSAPVDYIVFPIVLLAFTGLTKNFFISILPSLLGLQYEQNRKVLFFAEPIGCSRFI